MRGFLLTLFGATLAVATPARAAWMEASSQHFVIYANESPDNLRVISERLERFHHAMELLLGLKPEPPSPSTA
jgi:hypothetical protein